MEYMVACHDPEFLEALCAFATELASLSDPRGPRGVHHALTVLPATLLDGTSLPGLQQLTLALKGKVARRSGDRAALNMVRTVRQHSEPNLSIGLLRDRIGRQL